MRPTSLSVWTLRMVNLAPLHGAKLALMTFSLSLAIFMNVLDISIANVAIPTLAGNLAASPDDGTWVITSFAVSQAIMLPITGWLARRFGEVRLFLFSTLLFTLASVFCGLSTSLPMLIFFRVVQGAVSGPMIPLSQSILLSNYPDSRKTFATSIWATTAVVAPIIGPVLGGWITDNYSWPWIFYINVPVGIFSVVVTRMMLAGRDTAIEKRPIDLIGLALLVIGVGCLQVLLDQGNDLDWFHSNVIVILTAISVISLCFLLLWELTDKNPVVDFKLFSNRNFLVGVVALSLGYMVYFANVVIFPLWLQTQMGFTATWAGLAAAPVGILPFLLSPVLGLFLYKLNLRIIVSLGFIIFALTSFWQSNFYTDVGYLQLIEPRFVQGLGLALFFTPIITIMISSLPPTQIATALGLGNFFRIIGGSFGTSISVTMWDRRESFHHSRLVENIYPNNPIAVDTFQQLKAVGITSTERLKLVDDVVTNQAYMLATNDIFWLSGAIFLVLIVVIWFAKPPFFGNKATILTD
jgi:DHA2 family multidrug resistance protein